MNAPDLGAKVADLSARLAMVEHRLDALETSPQDRIARALAALADKIDAQTPGRVPANETAKAEARARLLAVE